MAGSKEKKEEYARRVMGAPLIDRASKVEEEIGVLSDQAFCQKEQWDDYLLSRLRFHLLALSQANIFNGSPQVLDSYEKEVIEEVFKGSVA
jgi:hypothetical protein